MIEDHWAEDLLKLVLFLFEVMSFSCRVMWPSVG